MPVSIRFSASRRPVGQGHIRKFRICPNSRFTPSRSVRYQLTFGSSARQRRVRDRYFAVLSVNNGNRRAPVALATDSPITGICN